MRRGASTAIALVLTIVVAIVVVGGCTRPKPTQEPSAQVMGSPTIEAPPGATEVSAEEATPTLVPPGEMPPDLTQTLAASPTEAVTPVTSPTTEGTLMASPTAEGTLMASPTAEGTPTTIPTSPPGVPTPTPTPTSTTPPGTSAPIVHIVQRGENLFRIALRYNTTVEAITAANGISNPQLIYVGQKLTIPQGGGTTPPDGGRTHVVQPGENLFRIALRYGTTAQAIAAANNLPNIHLIYAGQVLRIP
jgi:LysM repeat protein